MPDDEPREWISTPDAARALGISRSALWRWWQDGLVTPAWTTPGGQGRWDLDELRRQVNQIE